MNKLTPKHFLCVSAVVLALAAGGWPQNANAQTPPAPAATNTSVVPTTPVEPPPDIVPGSPYAEVVRLTQAGVDQSIIMTYITNCTSLFNLDSEKIIYLSDLGAPTTVVTAMMQHDQQLQQQFAATQAAQQAPSVVAAPEPATTNTAEVVPPTEPAPVTVNYFYDTLAPYGSWVVVGGYGRCWRPTVCAYNPGWQPYCDNGHWVYTDCGWYWASTYAWGATFHYGRWFRDASVGWCWYPDTIWAPSWVTWRYSNNYCGWAPLPPRTTYRAGVGIVYNGGNVSVGFGFGLGASCFTFVPTQYFCSSHPRNYCVAPAQVTQVYNNTTVINNYNINNRTIVNHGIAVQNIAAASHAPIRPVPVHQVNSAVVAGWQSPHIYHSSAVPGARHQSYSSPPQAQHYNVVPTTSQHSGYKRDFGSPLRTPGSPQGYSPPPQAQHYNAVSTTPQHSAPAAKNNYNNYTNPREKSSQPPAVNQGSSNPQSAPKQWQPTGTPRSMTRPNYYHSAAQQSAPAYAPAPAQPQQGGYQHQQGGYQQQGGNHYGNNGNQKWPGH